LLPDVTLHGAAVWAERARAQVEKLSFFVGGIGRITLSAGVAEVGRQEDPLAALKRADASLYEAKAEGGNRVGSSLAQLKGGMRDPASV
jgi:PleD family two-component response regulator